MSLSLRKATLVLILATAATVLLSPPVHADDPLAGTWVLNLEKSKFNPGPPPKSKTRVYEVTESHEKMVATTIDILGKQAVQKYSAARDGKDYPFEGWQIADTVSVMPVDIFTVNYTMKKDGIKVITGTRTVSDDGRELTFPIKFTNSNGQTVDNIEIFNKLQ